jgi:hypothetical protein
MMSCDLPESGAILSGPFWPGQVRVLTCSQNGDSVRVQAVGVADSQFYDRTLTLDQFRTGVTRVLGGIHQFTARRSRSVRALKWLHGPEECASGCATAPRLLQRLLHAANLDERVQTLQPLRP